MKSFNSLTSSSVLIWDETLRDGEQTPGVYFSPDNKIMLAKQLDKLGVDIIDVGFPLISKEEFLTVKKISELKKYFHAEIGITMRAIEKDVSYCKDLDIDNFLFSAPADSFRLKPDKLLNSDEHIYSEKGIELSCRTSDNIGRI